MKSLVYQGLIDCTKRLGKNDLKAQLQEQRSQTHESDLIHALAMAHNPVREPPPAISGLSREEVKALAQQEKLRALLFLFDKILKEEYAGSDSISIPIYHSPSCGPSEAPGFACDFCGADIFQAFFVCEPCAAFDEGEEAVVICPSCYVEGRACRCAIMKPRTLRPFEDLQEIRELAKKCLTITNYGPQKL